jgi:malonyl-CoA/methylmalonyl-CoA synthetase
MPEKTKEKFADGYFKTGDVGRVDADGYVTIVGRSKDLIISGGWRVPGRDRGHYQHLPGVAERGGGVPDADFGEVGVAVVIAKRVSW